MPNFTLTSRRHASDLRALEHPDIPFILHHLAPSSPTQIPLPLRFFAPDLHITIHTQPLPLCILTPHETHYLLPTSLHQLKPSCFVWINPDFLTDRCFVQITLCTKNLWLHQLKANYTVIDRRVSCYILIGKNNSTILKLLLPFVSVSDLFWTYPEKDFPM